MKIKASPPNNSIFIYSTLTFIPLYKLACPPQTGGTDIKFHSPFICCTTQTAGSHAFANLYNQLWTLYAQRGCVGQFCCVCAATDVSQSLPHLHIVYLVAN